MDEIAASQPTATRKVREFPRGGRLVFGDLRVEVASDPVTVGRDPSSDLALSAPEVSALHCEFRATPAGVLVRDLESHNGTFVGALRVREAYLTDACVLSVGGVEVRFEPTLPSVAPTLVDARASFGPLVGAHPRMQKLYSLLETVAKTSLSVLIGAETGTGKELVARAIHGASERADGPFVVVDCGALPSTLAESILFGHERGSFTGATNRTDGAFREAEGGTLFLDELGELPEEMQPKLLRAVAERSVKRVGGSRYEPVDVRIIAATRRDLRVEMNAARFREDLFFRLAQIRLEIPPLRERIDDIPLVVAAVCRRLGADDAVDPVVRHIEQRFRGYDWPGNVRELVNVASVLAALGEQASGAVLDGLLPLEGTTNEPSSFASPTEFVLAKRNFEERYFRELLRAAEGNISEVARRCGLARHQVRQHLRKLGLAEY